MELLKESESAAKKSINAVAIVLSIANVVDRCSEETSSRFSSGTEPKSRKWSTLRGQIIVPRVVVKLGQASWLVLTKKLCSQALRYARCSALAALRLAICYSARLCGRRRYRVGCGLGGWRAFVCSCQISQLFGVTADQLYSDCWRFPLINLHPFTLREDWRVTRLLLLLSDLSAGCCNSWSVVFWLLTSWCFPLFSSLHLLHAK